MQCTSFIPVYYQPRSVNGTTGGFPWHLLNGNGNYGDQRGFNSSLQPSTLYQYSSYDKDAMRQIIQNHESTFRYQVEELHRLYKRQRELMDEMRMREIVVQHMQTPESVQCLSQPQSDISQTSHTPNLFLGDHSHSKLPSLAVNNIHQSRFFVTNNVLEQQKNSCNEVDFLTLRNENHQKRSLDLELPANVYCASDVPNKLIHVQPTIDSNSGRMNYLIDLNEPMQLESLSSNSIGAFATHNSHLEIMCKDSGCGSEEAKPESPRPVKRGNSTDIQKKIGDITLASSEGRNLSMAIDLNSMPLNCFSETEATLESVPRINKETTVVLDKILETETCMDFNASVVNEHLRVNKSARGLGSEGPSWLENEECSFRQKSKDVQLQTPILSEKLEEKVKPPLELNIVAAQTLLVISSSIANSEEAGNSKNWLYWFADIVSSTGENFENDDITGFGTRTEKIAIEKEREMAEGFLESHRPRKNVSRKGCLKSRKCSKVVSSDTGKKSTSSMLKQPATRSRQGLLQNWGRIRKRQGGHRRRTSKFPAIN